MPTVCSPPTARSSIPGGTPEPSQARGRGAHNALGPSDRSDSGSDVIPAVMPPALMRIAGPSLRQVRSGP
jgi:hypothetical protein